MSEHDPPFASFVIPLRPGGDAEPAIRSIRAIDYPQDCFEILVVEGRSPSVQRNRAIEEAKGKICYLLDDDTELDALAVWRALECLLDARDPDLVCAGGPMLTRPGASPFQQAVGAAMASVVGLGPARHRHYPYGPIREVTETSLLSANLAVDREAILRIGGFDPRLYPNEENELLKRVRSAGLKCVYHPLMTASRGRRWRRSKRRAG